MEELPTILSPNCVVKNVKRIRFAAGLCPSSKKSRVQYPPATANRLGGMCCIQWIAQWPTGGIAGRVVCVCRCVFPSVIYEIILNRGTPTHHPCVWIFHQINHPPYGVPPFWETPR